MAVYTVGQISQYIKQVLSNDDLLRDLWVSGEVSNTRISQSGHAYFTIKDDSSQLRCVMFRNSAGMDMLIDGAAITSHGYFSFYNARGSLDLVTDIIVAIPQFKGVASSSVIALGNLRIPVPGKM